MEKILCWIYLFPILLSGIHADSLLTSTSYTTPGGSYEFDCRVDARTTIIHFYRSDQLNPVCSIKDDCIPIISSKYKCGCTRTITSNYLRVYNVSRDDADVKWHCGNPAASQSMLLLYKSEDEACSVYKSKDTPSVTTTKARVKRAVTTVESASLGGECGVDIGVNKICVDPNTVCSQVSQGFKKCMCDRNYADINGTCDNVPYKLFTTDFVNETITPGENRTIDYKLNVTQLSYTGVEIIPALLENVKYRVINGTVINIMVFNTRNLSSENVMIRVIGSYDGVRVQDSTVLRLHVREPPIEECPTVTPQSTSILDVQNVTLGAKCGLDKEIDKICVDVHTVCSQFEGLKSCQCDRNYAEKDGQCVDLPNRLFKTDYIYQAILANIQPDIILKFDLDVSQKYLADTRLDLIPEITNIEVNGIENDQVQIIVNETKSLQSEVIMLKMEAVYSGVKIYDSMIVKLEIVINQTFDQISIDEELPNGIFVHDFSLEGFKDFEFVDCPQFIIQKNEILTKQPLDRETRDTYYCKIKGTYIKDKQCTLRDVGFVRIILNDVNDNPPVFTKQLYNGRVKENQQSVEIEFDREQQRITTSDLDINPNNNIVYTLSGSDSLPFSVTSNNRDAVIKVKSNSKINKEKKDKYTFTIEASDGINRNTATVIIDVDDVNEPARFQQNIYNFSVSEGDSNTLVGYIIAVDEDQVQEFRNNKYTIISGSFQYFEIDQNGTLYLVNRPEQKPTLNFELLISVSDDSLPDERVTTTVLIQVTGVNESPIFNQTSPYTFSVYEGDACIEKVGQVAAYEVDFEGTANSVFEFSIDSGSLFKVDPQTGMITCKNPLDSETDDKSFELEITATDKGSPPLSSTKQVIVNVLDVNDNYPILDVGPPVDILCCNIKIRDKPIAVVKASDADSGENGRLSFSITKYNDDDIFAIVDSGLVSVNKEASCNKTEYTIEITCSDNGDPPLSVRRNMTIKVKDSTGVETIFKDTEIIVNIKEEEMLYKNISFKESIKSSSDLRLEFEEEVPNFSIGKDYTLIVNGTFDRESKAEYTFVLKATTASASDTALIKVYVNDVNDNPPVIDKAALGFSIDEGDVIGRFLGKVSASDADIGINAKIIFSFVVTDVPFIINNTTGYITTSKSLDREKISSYELQVKASDGVHEDFANITVEIVDVNDNAPVIHLESKSINAIENTVQKSITVNVTDADISDGKMEIYILKDQNCLINWSKLTLGLDGVGEFKFTDILDYEAQTTYECVLTATDGKYFTNETLVINVIDINDNSPVFHQVPKEISVDIATVPGYVLVEKINATDSDSGSNGQITFSIKPEDNFRIDSKTGQISLISLKSDDLLNLTIIATDGGILPQTSKTNIIVKVLDDQPKPRISFVPENPRLTENNKYQNLSTVTAIITTLTGEKQCEFHYKIKGNSNFYIDELNGNISLREPLDRETSGVMIGLVVVAETNCNNNLLSSSATLNIIVEDVNDNRPSCSDQQLPSISQSLTIGGLVGKIRAEDKDEGINGTLKYTIRSTIEYFKIDSKTGEIGLLKNFPFSREDATYVMSVLVEDPDFNTICYVSIDVTPENKYGPVFLNKNYKTSLSIDAEKGEVLKVDSFKAVDKENDTITYSLDTDQNIFQINTTTDGPVITLKSDIQDDVQTVIVLKVYAEDNISPIKTGTCTINIVIEGQLCIQEAFYNGVLENADTSTKFQILFYSMVSALSLCVVLLIIACYKWRTTNREKSKLASKYSKALSGFAPTREMPYTDIGNVMTDETDTKYETVGDNDYSPVTNKYYSRTVNPLYQEASYMDNARSSRSSIYDLPMTSYE